MVYPTLKIEESLWSSGYSLVCGIDEVGRGSFAGPVCVGAVIFPKNCELLNGVADSKLLKPKERERLDKLIKISAISWFISEINVSVINKVGIGKATQIAFRKAVKSLDKKPDFVLIDAFYIKHLNRKRQKAVKEGDSICASISAASIIAKVYRDKLMEKLSKKYPKYGFSKHKGYGTKLHQDMIKKYGLSRIHRKSFNLSRFMSNDI
ncbi:ribonuclease HII [Candidatus Daviesbacteria bacterium RIFCSPLOWO2_02_FULL_36_8]|uniref:Ribonuclease HII n=1 Tax=Candidatus Daviesbacteria bacterium RIFCSPLOWO2_02_FULL_36_8 TaxID=1797793 RepID=A0A1F5MGP3_9BACT|nr:MAG: ribonuclease HII [Candidatus Daviesbacteria bacterium RIFCSPLOWO2_02_FULL_36_8]